RSICSPPRRRRDMTEADAAETPTEPVLPVLPSPVAAAELEAEPAPPDAAPDANVAAETPDQAPAPEADAPAPEVAFANGSTSDLVVDHFIDSEGDQSMNQIKAALPHIAGNTIESAVRRLAQQGRL